jgi:hypothetical protein
MNAPPILSKLDFIASEGALIIIELEEFSEIKACFDTKTTLFFSSDYDEIRQAYSYSSGILVDSIQKFVKAVKVACGKNPGININFVLHRVDLMDLEISKKARGSLRKGLLMTLTKKVLGKCNVIITSSTEEYMLRELCDRHINLRISRDLQDTAIADVILS